MSGILTLYHGDNVILTRQYCGRAMREAYVEQYRKMYGPGWSKIRVVDEPGQPLPPVRHRHKPMSDFEKKKLWDERKQSQSKKDYHEKK